MTILHPVENFIPPVWHLVQIIPFLIITFILLGSTGWDTLPTVIRPCKPIASVYTHYLSAE